MALFDLFRRKSKPFAIASIPHPPAPVPLTRAPVYQLVPVNVADPLDAQVARMWLAYQRDRPTPTWSGFLAVLIANNTELAEQVRRAQSDLNDYRSWGVFKP